MKDFIAITKSYSEIGRDRKSVLATVVRVKGSSYRSPGARMLIMDDGKWVGSISGGCLEGDALRKARQVMADGLPRLVTYDTREESNQNLGIGLGCNGVIDVLLEPITEKDNPISFFQTFVDTEQPLALATIISGSLAGRKTLASAQGHLIHNTLPDDMVQLVCPGLLQLFQQQRSHVANYTVGEETTEVFLELIQPNISLLIFGGGFDARPVSQLAKSLGWHVTVTDECVAHIAPVFFPGADHLSLCHRNFIDRDFRITNYTACVLMSHNYEYDRDVLRKLLSTNAPYIGILGPRKRFEKMLAEFKTENVQLAPHDMARIHSPIGLDIGAEAPDEIALSIVAEIQSKFSNRSGGFLKYRSAPIHQRDQQSGQVFKQVFLSNEIDNQSAHA